MANKLSSPGLAFAKALRSLETGGLSISDVLAELSDLLDGGAAPGELREIALGRDLIEPLSAQARAGILKRLDAAMVRQPEQSVAASGPPTAAADSAVNQRADSSPTTPHPIIPALSVEQAAAIARAAALETELAATRAELEAERRSAREVTRTAAESAAGSLVALESERYRADQAIADAGVYRTEAESLRKKTSEHDTAMLQLRQSLTHRDSRIDALTRQHSEIVSALDAHANDLAKRETELQAAQIREATLQADLSKTRTISQADRSRAQLEYQSLQEQLQRVDAELATLRGKHEAELAQLRESAARHLENSVRTAVVAEQGTAPTASQASAAETQIAAAETQTSAAETRFPTFEAQSVVPELEPVPAEHEAAPRPVRRIQRPMLVACAILGAAILLGWLVSHRATVPAKTSVESKTAVSSETPVAGTVIRDCATCPALTVVPPGRFKQGSPNDYGGAPAAEKPQHWVVIGKPFALSTTPITVGQFGEFITASGRDMPGCDIYDGSWKTHQDKSWKDPGFMQSGSHPVVCVSSNDGADYAAWLSAQTGHRYRLPSASEWEYAARAGTDAVQPWGAVATDACQHANVADQSAADQFPGWQIFACDDGYVYTSPVGSFEANAFGLKDMLGNVFQWTADCWNATYTAAPIDGSARADGDCTQRELRGGSWFSSPDYVRANYRNRFAADYRSSSVGIRLVREIEP